MFDRERIVYHRGGLVFALRGDAYAHVDDVPNGLACGCVCEECQATLVARNRGEILASHFAHAAGEKCGNTGEAGLARAAASILTETRCLMVPAVTVGQVLRDAHEITIESAVAATVRGKVPEVRVTAGKRTLRLFVRPSMRTPPKVRDDVVRQGLSAMQLDVLPNPDGVVTAGDLIDALIGRRCSRRWLLNTRASMVAPLPSSTLQARLPSSGQTYNRSYALSPFFYEPGQFTTDRIVEIETNIYEAPGERLIWSAATTSTNPGNVQVLIKDAAMAIRTELMKEKLIPQS